MIIRGEGEQPYSAIENCGVSFEGGHLIEGNRYMGYMQGTAEQIADAMACLAPWQPEEITAAEAVARAERIQPTNSKVESRWFVGPATIDPASSRVVRDLDVKRW